MAFFDWLFGKKNGHVAPSSADNLQRWRDSGEALRWVQARGGNWGHDDWLALIQQLQGSAYWPMEPDAIGKVLEELKQT